MKSILYYGTVEQTDFSRQGLVVGRGKDIPDLLIQEETSQSLGQRSKLVVSWGLSVG